MDQVKQADDKENENKTDESASSPPRRYRTRSSLLKSDTNDSHAQPPPKKERAPVAPKPKPAFIDYKGKVEYYTEFNDIAFASDILL